MSLELWGSLCAVANPADERATPIDSISFGGNDIGKLGDGWSEAQQVPHGSASEATVPILIPGPELTWTEHGLGLALKLQAQSYGEVWACHDCSSRAACKFEPARFRYSYHTGISATPAPLPPAVFEAILFSWSFASRSLNCRSLSAGVNVKANEDQRNASGTMARRACTSCTYVDVGHQLGHIVCQGSWACSARNHAPRPEICSLT